VTLSNKSDANRSKLDSKLIRYALAGSAVLAAPAAADASIIYSGTVNSSIEQTGSGPSSSTLNVTLDGSLTDFTLTAQVGGGVIAGVSVSGPGTTYFVADGVGPKALTLGTLISAANATGSGGNLSTSTGSPVSVKSGNWSADEVPAYLGLRFDISGSAHYGWAQLSIDVDGGVSPRAYVNLIDYAYESQADVSILAGDTTVATPEPSSLALFALGAAGVMALRRKRQSQQN
jgi:hypothetical protein